MELVVLEAVSLPSEISDQIGQQTIRRSSNDSPTSPQEKAVAAKQIVEDLVACGGVKARKVVVKDDQLSPGINGPS